MAKKGLFGQIFDSLDNKDTRNRNSSRGSGQDRARANQAYTGATNAMRNQETLNRLRGLSGGGQSGGSSGGGGYRSGGGGGGGGGPSAYEQWQMDEEKRRQQELLLRKTMLTNQLTGARDQARPLLNQYNQQYNKDIGGVFQQNRSLNAGYNQQLAAIANQLRGQTSGTSAGLQRDLQGQGAGAPDIQAMQAGAGQVNQGTNFMDLLGQQYNTRLAQVMAQRQADAQAMGAATKASSSGQLENSYAQALAQIGMIGLT